MIDLTLGDTALIRRAAKKRGLTKEQTSYVLATAKWETAHTMKPVTEAYWLSEQWRATNLRYYPWHGRGYVQLTWKDNYKRASQKVGVDLIADPEKALDPKVAAEILVNGMMEGWFTGRKLPDYVNAQKTDFHGARRVVNGTDKAAQIADIADEYFDALPDRGKGKMVGIGAALAALLAALTQCNPF